MLSARPWCRRRHRERRAAAVRYGVDGEGERDGVVRRLKEALAVPRCKIGEAAAQVRRRRLALREKAAQAAHTLRRGRREGRRGDGGVRGRSGATGGSVRSARIRQRTDHGEEREEEVEDGRDRGATGVDARDRRDKLGQRRGDDRATDGHLHTV